MPDTLTIPYSVTSPGNVSIVVQNPAGQTVREIQRGVPTQPGSYTAMWDGLDRFGVPCPPGQYTWNLLRTPGFTRTLKANLGINTPWAPMDRWPGNHGCVNLLMADATGVYVSSNSSEGPPSFLKMALDGSAKIWDSMGSTPSELNSPLLGMAKVPNTGGKLTGACVPSNIFYMLSATPAGPMLKINRDDTGSQFWGTYLKAFAQSPLISLLHVGDTATNYSPMRMCGGPDFIAVTYARHNEVLFIWPQDGGIVGTITVSVPTPGDVTVTPAGLAYVVSGGNIVSVDPASGNVATVWTTPVWRPAQISYDPAFGDLLIICGPFINRCNIASATTVVSYGSLSGRTYGLFNADEFDGLLDVEADGSGGFFTTEMHPRRVAHFGMAALPPQTVVRTAAPIIESVLFPELTLPSGQVLPPVAIVAPAIPTFNFPIPGPIQYDRTNPICTDQHFGGLQWGSQACIDPADTTIVYLPVDELHIGRGRIDYGSNTWSLDVVYDQVSHESWTLGNSIHEDILTFGGERIFWSVSHVGGQTYLTQRGGSNGLGRITVVRVDDAQNKLYPVAFLGSLHPSNDVKNLQAWWLQALSQNLGINTTTFQGAAGYTHFAFTWSDQNGDGNVDLSEILLSSVGSTYLECSGHVDSGFNITRPNAHPAGTPAGLWLSILNDGTNTTPKWDWGHATGHGAYLPGDVSQSRLGNLTSVWKSADGSIYAVASNTSQTFDAADAPPTNWPNNATHSARLLKWDSAGNPLFSVGVHRDYTTETMPGWAFGSLRAIIGEVNGCVVVMDGQVPASVWTSDGLYAGSFYDDAPAHAHDVGWQKLAYPIQFNDDDNQWGSVIQDTATGNVYWLKGLANSTPAYQVSGWDGWERQSGALTITAPAVAALAQGTGLAAVYNGGPARIDPAIWFGPLNGYSRGIPALNPWPIDPTKPVSAVWTGFIEAPLSETFEFHVYSYESTPTSGAQVKLTIGGVLVLDSWSSITPSGKTAAGFIFTRPSVSVPVPMLAGQKLPIKIEYAFPGNPNALLHLYWQSQSLDLRHVPQAYLYPA